MIRRRREKAEHSHYCLLVNKSASGYNPRTIKRLTEQIRSNNGYYTIFEPDSAVRLHQTAQKVCGLRQWHHSAPQQLTRRGKVTAIVACGGDGTVNLSAQNAVRANLPIGILPMGSLNNIARSLYGTDDADDAIKRIVERKYRKIDTATIDGKFFVGSAGLGFAPQMAEMLLGRRRPRFCLGWSQLAAKAASQVTLKKTAVRIDSFRFEFSPIIVNINLLPYSFGLPLSPASIVDDQTAEIIFNYAQDSQPFSTFIRLLCKNKYVYGDKIKLFRGKEIRIEPVKGLQVYIDGEIMELSGDQADVKISDKQLKVFF